MAEYAELVKKLRNKYRAYMATDNEKPGMLFRDAADAIESLLEIIEDAELELGLLKGSLPKWIPVTERLPEEKDRYLTVSIEPWFGTTVVDIMRWSGVWMYDGRQTEATVTHWMPLQEPPKEETE